MKSIAEEGKLYESTAFLRWKMDWEKIVGQIPTAIEKVRTDYVVNNMIIKDDIFGILDKYCIVVYYPIEKESNRGFKAVWRGHHIV